MAGMSKPTSLPPKRRWFGGVGCALTFALGVPAILLLSCLSGWLYFRFQHAGYARQLAEQEQRVRDAGEPLTGAELNEWYRVPEGEENLTDLYLSIFETMEREEPADKSGVPWFDPDIESEAIPLPGNSWDDIARSEAFLANYEETFKLLEQTLEREGSVRYPGDYREGIAMRLDSIQQLRLVMRLCLLRAAVLIHKGDHAAATEMLIATLRAAETTKNQPGIVPQLVRVAMHSAADDAIAFALADEDFPKEQVKRLIDELSAVDRDSGSYVAMIGERAGLIHPAFGLTIHQLSADYDAQPPQVGAASNSPLREIRPGDCALTLELCSDAVEACSGTYPDIWQTQDAQAARVETVLAQDGQAFLWNKHIVTQLLLPAYSTAYTAFARGAAQHRCTIALLAAELHRRARGDYPQRLADLAPQYLPELPTDPYTGEPLRMKHEPGGRFIVYTVGKDGSDDGGDIDTLPGHQPRDIGLSVPPLRAEPMQMEDGEPPLDPGDSSE